MTNNLITDLSCITRLSEETLTALFIRAEECIGHCVFESVVDKENLTEIDIGIGTLYIKREDSQIKYKFIPSKNLEEKVTSTVRTRKSPLIKRGEKALKSRVERTYKDLL
jgi:hypothetical protein